MTGTGLPPRGVASTGSSSESFESRVIGSNEYEITEDSNGDLVVRDDAGNDVFIWDKSAGQWDFKSQDVTNLASLGTDEASITRAFHGYEYTIGGSTSELYAVDADGAVVAGGPDAVNVSDAGDFGEVLQEVVNNQAGSGTSIRLAGGVNPEFKTTANLDHVIHLWGPGKNRGNIQYSSSFPSNSDGIDLTNVTGSKFICRFDSLKFSVSGGTAPDNHISFDGAHEMQLTHCEFRDSASGAEGVKLQNGQDSGSGAWNIVFDCWFLAGSDLFVDNYNNIRLIGNRFVGSGSSDGPTINNSKNVHRAGNELESGASWSFTSTSFTDTDWEFGSLGATIERAPRVTSSLSFEYNSLSDVPNWTSNDSGQSTWTYNVNSRPRRLHAEHDGSNSSSPTGLGGFQSPVLATFQSLGEYKITFHAVSFTQNATANAMNVGISTQDATTDIAFNGDGFCYRSSDQLRTVTGGSSSANTNVSNIDWTNNHDVTLEYDGSEVRLIIDGTQEASSSYSTNADFRPVFQVFDDEGETSSETVEVEAVTVQPIAP